MWYSPAYKCDTLVSHWYTLDRRMCDPSGGPDQRLRRKSNPDSSAIEPKSDAVIAFTFLHVICVYAILQFYSQSHPQITLHFYMHINFTLDLEIIFLNSLQISDDRLNTDTHVLFIISSTFIERHVRNDKSIIGLNFPSFPDCFHNE
jgi:hypothetical protein